MTSILPVLPYYVRVEGIIGCSVTACIERCSCCSSMTLKYYDGAWMRCHLGVPSAADAAACMERNANHSNAEPHEVSIKYNMQTYTPCNMQTYTPCNMQKYIPCNMQTTICII